MVRVFDGSSGEWLARVMAPQVDNADVRRSRRSSSSPCLVECMECLRPQTRTSSSPSLWLVPPKKKERLRWLVEKATELGVQQFMCLDSDYSESGSLGYDKLRLYVLEAAEQCERQDIPSFVETETEPRFDAVVNEWSSKSDHGLKTKLLFCRERGEHSIPVLDALQRISHEYQGPDLPQIAFVVGPEGGWSAREQGIMDKLVLEYPQDAFNVSLGTNVLRAETAAVTAIAAFTMFHDREKP